MKDEIEDDGYFAYVDAIIDMRKSEEKRKMEYKHELKSWIGLFEPIFKGEKTHDLRVLDRDFQIGDTCKLREYNPFDKTYTGRELYVEITYITSSKHQECAFSPMTLHPATGILSIKLVK